MLKKYQIYISSAPDDLKTERRELIKIITELGSIPVTMDNFNINEDENHGLIEKTIQESDYFVNLTAYKCGPAVGKTFGTEMELSWAEKFKIPVLAFVIDEKARWKANKKDKEKDAVKNLEIFKKRLGNHTLVNWVNTADLCQKACIYLVREMNLNPRQGWVRGDDAVTPATANELARLIRENEHLKTHISVDGGKPESRIRGYIKHCLKILATAKISLSFWYVNGENWENTQTFSYLRLFKLLAPELTAPKTTSEITRFLGTILNPDLEKTVRKDNPTPTNTIKKIMADFSMLKLTNSYREGKNRTSGDYEGWELNEYGKEVFAVNRLRQMNKALKKQVHTNSEQVTTNKSTSDEV